MTSNDETVGRLYVAAAAAAAAALCFTPSLTVVGAIIHLYTLPKATLAPTVNQSDARQLTRPHVI